MLSDVGLTGLDLFVSGFHICLVEVLCFSTVCVALWEEWRKQGIALGAVHYFILWKRIGKSTKAFSDEEEWVAGALLLFCSFICSRCLWH